MTARAPLDAVIIEIQVSDASPARAAALANAITRQLEATVQELDSGVTAGAPGSVGAGTVDVARVAPASPPQFPAAPRRTLNLALALVFGVLGGCVLAISLDALDARVGGRQEVARVTTAPVIGRISGRVRRLPRLFALLRRLERPGEQTRQLRTNFQRVQRDRSISSVVFTSALDDAATAQTVSELAVALADTGAQVLLVDADLRRPSLARQHGTDDRVGLSQVLDGDVRLVDAVRRSARAELDVLPAGPPVFDPSNVLGAPAMVRLLAEAADRYELVLVKAAPVLRIADGLVLSPRADGVVIVADDRRFHRTALAEEVRVLDLVGARLIGVVLTV